MNNVHRYAHMHLTSEYISSSGKLQLTNRKWKPLFVKENSATIFHFRVSEVVLYFLQSHHLFHTGLHGVACGI